MPWHTLLLTIIASYTKLSSEMVLALTNKSVQNHGVIQCGIPKLMGSNHMDVSDGHNGGRMGQNAPTVPKIGVVPHLLNRETRFSAEIWCKKNQKR